MWWCCRCAPSLHLLQEQSRAPAFPADRVCEDTLPYLATLVAAIREASPAAVLQFYLTWGRPFGYAADCPTYPQFCDFPSMQVPSRITSSPASVLFSRLP